MLCTTATKYLHPSYPCNAAWQCHLTPALQLQGFLVGFGDVPTHGLCTPGFCKTHTYTLGHRYRFSVIQVQVALENPRVTHANLYQG